MCTANVKRNNVCLLTQYCHICIFYVCGSYSKTDTYRRLSDIKSANVWRIKYISASTVERVTNASIWIGLILRRRHLFVICKTQNKENRWIVIILHILKLQSDYYRNDGSKINYYQFFVSLYVFSMCERSVYVNNCICSSNFIFWMNKEEL